MTTTEAELRRRLEGVSDPDIGADIGSLGLINDVAIDGETARVSLALNAPYAPAEIELGNAVRDAIEAAGLQPDLRASVSEAQGFDETVLPKVRNVIAVASGKGGVGKTTVAANVAAGLEKRGAHVGILDADVHGPNVPRLLPVEGEPGVTPNDEIVPPRSNGVRVMSMGFLTETQDDPAVLRGPMLNNVMNHFLDDVEWGRLDYLIVDLPPGTGDASLDLLQTLPVTGVVIVTTPQAMAVSDARKGLRLFEKHDTPIVGVVENMSTFRCPSCDDEHEVFGHGGAEAIGADYDVPVLPRLPIHPDIGDGGEDGPVVTGEGSPADRLEELVCDVADRVGEINRRKVAEHRSEPDDTVPTEAEAD
ncbi:MAG: Mrp/NBP35 family ATP-binding protein [Natronomonas sp.]